MKRLGKLLLLSFLLQPLSNAADLVIIVHLENPIETLTKQQLVDIYMGRDHVFPNGQRVIPFDYLTDSPERADFYRQLVNRSLAQIGAYWSRLQFAGRGQPPHQLKNYQAMLQIVRENPEAIGYIDSQYLDKSVKVVTHVN